MRVIALLILTMFMSCDGAEKRPELETREAPKTSIAEPTQAVEKDDPIPDWIKQLHESTEDLPEHLPAQRVIDYRQLSDSISWGIIRQFSGVCDQKILISYLKQTEKNRAEISSHCDHDLSVPHHQWKQYELLATDKFRIDEFAESVPDSLVDDNGRMKKGFSYDELEKQLDSVSYHLLIQPDGRIVKE